MEYIRPDFIQIPYVILEHTEIDDTSAKVYGMVYFLSQLSKRKCTASNEYIATLLFTSPQTVANSLTALEKWGFIRRMFVDDNPKKGRKEIIPLVQYHSPTGESRFHPQVKDHSPTGEQSKKSNKNNILGANAHGENEDVETQAVDDNGNPIEEKKKKDTTYRQVFELWGDYPVNWRSNTTEIAAAKNLLKESTLEDMEKMLKYYQKNKSDPYCPTILKPTDLDRKWDNLLDFKKKKHG